MGKFLTQICLYDRILEEDSIFLRKFSKKTERKGMSMSKTMLDYIREIPNYVKDSICSSNEEPEKLVDSFDAGEYSSVTIVASGSSFHAAGCAKYYLRDKLNVPVYVETPFTFVHYESIDRKSFYLVISQSGRSVNSLNAIKRLCENHVAVHFLTDNEDLVSTEEMTVYRLKIGNETVPFVTKGFSATVFWLILFAHRAYCRKHGEVELLDIPAFTTCFEQQMKKAAAFFEDNKNDLMGMKRIHVCGAGPGQFVAKEGALKFCETLQMNATGYEIEEFLHGANFELKRDHTVFLISSSEATDIRVRQLKENLPFLCDRVYAIERLDQWDERIAAILYCCFFQTLVYLINKEGGNEIPLMKKEYLMFEDMMKAKTMNYYE